MDAMPPLDLDRLLTDTTFVRRIARALVRDPDAAEDLAQDAIVVALERPPGAGTNLRGWLATVVRSLAIDRARKTRARQHVEQVATDHAPGPEEIVARLDLSRQVAGALSDLEEPYRTTLYLRYVEELDPPSISFRLGVPLATTKTRLRRGLELLRTRLDRECGGRAAWSALAMPLATPPTPAALGAGTLLMSTAAKIAAALCLCGAAAWFLWPNTTADAPLSGPSLAAAPATDLAAPERDDVVRKAVVDAAPTGAGSAIADASARANGPFVRVLDERRFPVEGAHVVLHVAGFGEDETTTDAGGIARFTRLPGLEDEQRGAGLLAWDDLGRASARACSVRKIDAATQSASEQESLRSLGELLLAPGGSLSVRVEENGRPAPNATVWLEVGAARAGVVRKRADDQGRLRFEHLPARQVVVRAALDGREGHANTVLAVGREAELVVSLQPSRSIEVSVLDTESKSPIAGARVKVTELLTVTDEGDMGMRGQTFSMQRPLELEIPLTDARGLTRIVGVPAQGRYELAVEAELYVTGLSPKSQGTIPRDSDSVTLELNSVHPRRARWPLEAGEVAAPPSGTLLTLRKETLPRGGFESLEQSSPPPTRARIEDGAIVAEDVRDRIYGCYAVAPDGSLARLWIEDAAEVGHPTSFRRPRRVDVKLLDAQGQPVPGMPVELRNPGNNLLVPAGKTDEQGTVTFEGLWGRRVLAHAAGNELGAADLEKGDGRIEGRLPVARELAIRLRTDGSPGLPPSFRIWIAGATTVLSEDPATGIVRLRFKENAAEGPRSINVSAPGFLAASVQLEPTADPSVVVDVDLLRGGALLARVTAPRSGRVRLRAEGWDAEKGQWRTGSARQVSDERFAPNAPDGAYLFDGLAPGRYRVRDVDSERSSAGVEVLGGSAPAQVELDLSDIVRVRGVVELPEGVQPWSARIVVEGEGVAHHASTWLKGKQPEEGRPVARDGSFEVFVSASQAVTLRVAHPYLSPDPKQGSVIVRGEMQDVRLKLVQGDEVQIPLTAFQGESWLTSLRVYAYAGEPVGEPQAWFHAPVVDGTAHFSGLQHGTWTLWIDPGYAFAPIVARGVSVGTGITRVEVRPSTGSSVRVRVLHGEGTETPRVYVSARNKGEPMLLRETNSNGEDVVVLSGLSAGTYDVHLSQIGSIGVERTVAVDGQTDVEIEFDTRGSR